MKSLLHFERSLQEEARKRPRREPGEKIAVNFTVGPELYSAIKARASAERRTVAGFIRNLVADALEGGVA